MKRVRLSGLTFTSTLPNGINQNGGLNAMLKYTHPSVLESPR
jgi:hypothetical protein